MPRRPSPDQPDLFALPPSTVAPPAHAAPPQPPQAADILADPEGFLGVLDDADVRRLLNAVNEEARRRRLVLPEAARTAGPTGLAPGKEAAVRAALASGMSPRQVARNLGVPESTAKVLAKRR